MLRFLVVFAGVFLSLCLGWLAWHNIGRFGTQANLDVVVETQTTQKKDTAPLSVENMDSAIRIPFILTPENNISIPAVLNGTDQLQLMFHTAVDSVSYQGNDREVEWVQSDWVRRR